MRFLNTPVRTFDFTFEPCRRMRQPDILQVLHHILEYMAFGHKSVIEVQYFQARWKVNSAMAFGAMALKKNAALIPQPHRTPSGIPGM